MAKEPSTSDEKPKSLHVVCAPGDGAFSAYLALRYALAHQSVTPNVGVTMLCRDGGKEPPLAKVWWNLWSRDEEITQKLELKSAWTPNFVEQNSVFNPKDVTADRVIFILAGGDRSRLFSAFQAVSKIADAVVLKTEKDLLSAFTDGPGLMSTINCDDLLGGQGTMCLDPYEALHAVEMVHESRSLSQSLKSERVVSGSKKKPDFTFDIRWDINASLDITDPSRIRVSLNPIFENISHGKKGKRFTNSKGLRLFFNHHLELFRDWRKSVRFILEVDQKILCTLKNKVVDFGKIISTTQNLPAEHLSDECLYFKHLESPDGQELNTILMTWDSKNIGRSVQLLSLILARLTQHQCLILSSFHPSKEMSTEFENNIFLKRLISKPNSQNDFWVEGLSHIKTQKIKTLDLLSTVLNQRKSGNNTRIQLLGVGINGPSFRNIVNILRNWINIANLYLVSKDQVLESMLAPATFMQSNDSFIRGAFSLRAVANKPIQDFNKLSSQGKQPSHVASYLVWLHPTRGKSPLRGNFAVLDQYGKVIMVEKNSHEKALEFILYLSLERIRRYFFDNHAASREEITLILPKNGEFSGPLNPELWMSYKDSESHIQHSVFDAKARFGKGHEDLLDSDSVELHSKYSWNTLNGGLRVYSFSYFKGHGVYAHLQPHLFKKSISPNYSHRHSLYSLDLLELGRYILSFLGKTPNERCFSFQEYSESKTEFAVGYPRYTSKRSCPGPNQLGIGLFRPRDQKPTAQSRYSGFFYEPDSAGSVSTNRSAVGSDAFHFHEECLTKIVEWMLDVTQMSGMYSVSLKLGANGKHKICLLGNEGRHAEISVNEILEIQNASDLISLTEKSLVEVERASNGTRAFNPFQRPENR